MLIVSQKHNLKKIYRVSESSMYEVKVSDVHRDIGRFTISIIIVIQVAYTNRYNYASWSLRTNRDYMIDGLLIIAARL
jgi:hypothetical protein